MALPPLEKPYHACLCVRVRPRLPLSTRYHTRAWRRLDAYKEVAEGGGSPVYPGKHRPRLPRPTMAEIKVKRQRRQLADMRAQRWWEKQPTIAGEHCTAAQKYLADKPNFTGIYRRRFSRNSMRAISGDYCADPMRAERMLQSHTCAELTIPGRAADFRSEVEWRMRLRSRGDGIASQPQLPSLPREES